MEENNLKETLKVNNIQAPISTSSKIDELLKELGLFPLPKNVDINISDDNKYLNLKLIDIDNNQNASSDDHLLFQIPLKERDLSALQTRPDYSELLNRYHTYTNEYIDEIKSYAVKEMAYLKERFPELSLTIKLRIKSYESYINKINKRILEDKSPYINDIMAERIILNEYKGSQDEETLVKMCYEVAKALYDFRINTNFRMKEEENNNSAKTEKEYVTKDYIEHPKDNGYQSLHILMQNKKNKDFDYETQIRTFEMEEISKNNDKISHKEYKPRILNDLSVTRVPSYSIITQFSDEAGNPIIMDAPFDARFYHFYNDTIGLDKNLIDRRKAITYDDYRKELDEIVESLGISFKELREKLRNIDISKYIDNNPKSQDDNNDGR